MRSLQGVAWLLALQALGELLGRALGLPIPGPVIGLLLLLVALRLPSIQASVGEAANFLLSHLSLLFVPVGVGVMTHLGLLEAHGGRVVAVIVLSTWVGLGATAWPLHWLLRRQARTTPHPPADSDDEGPI
ncbi:CidA/LrgA family protein [Burkholderiaceae bacterium]|nr:CidA/LrgA family protein [Burkholderiaceae bacterium]